MKFFNTAGPCVPGEHYMLPAAERIPKARRHIGRGQYFVVHAPRQTGKTTSLAALAREVTAEGTYVALRFSCEAAGPFGDDIAAAEQAILGRLRAAADEAEIPDDCQPPTSWPVAAPGTALIAALTAWTRQSPRPIVLFFDEIDALTGASLVSTLRQLRDGYTAHRAGFLHSAVLCGMRDVRDYKAASGGDPTRLRSSSPFNIKVESVRIGDFTRDEVAALYQQHTEETGQRFTVPAIDLAFYYSQGQPWLVNALAAEIVDNMEIEGTITEDQVDTAKERLILARATHLDSLIEKLHEPRVQGVIEPIIAGRQVNTDPTFHDAISYVTDLGLIVPEKTIRIANPIYNEVIIRVLTTSMERTVDASPSDYRFVDGRLDMKKILTKFVSFWKLNGEILESQQNYHEVAPQLVMMAFLQRIVNGGGFIDREYGTGRGRIDLMVRQPYTDVGGQRAVQREVLELKVWRTGESNPRNQALSQIDGYLDRAELEAGTLVIFDKRDNAKPITERTALSQTTTPAGRTITLLEA